MITLIMNQTGVARMARFMEVTKDTLDTISKELNSLEPITITETDIRDLMEERPSDKLDAKYVFRYTWKDDTYMTTLREHLYSQIQDMMYDCERIEQDFDVDDQYMEMCED